MIVSIPNTEDQETYGDELAANLFGIAGHEDIPISAFHVDMTCTELIGFAGGRS